MSKKKSAKKARSASASRRKPAAARSSSRRKKTASKPRYPRKVQLKPIHVLVTRAIADLQRLPPSESTDITIKQLQHCSMALGDICDPQTPGGCGPNMEFPTDALAMSRA